MKKIIYYFWTLAAIFIFTSCGNDNYDAPAETFQGAFIDKDTNAVSYTHLTLPTT